jgi:hypothetical protein
MKNLIQLILILLLFINCKANNHSNKHDVSFSNTTSKADTIGTKEFGEKLLKGLIQPSDDNPTFACMDSLTSENKINRDFYWSVFQIILKKSDGALSEVVGSYLKRYLEKYPKEFANRCNVLGKEFKSKCIHFVAYEDLMIENESKNDEYYQKVIEGWALPKNGHKCFS